MQRIKDPRCEWILDVHKINKVLNNLKPAKPNESLFANLSISKSISRPTDDSDGLLLDFESKLRNQLLSGKSKWATLRNKRNTIIHLGNKIDTDLNKLTKTRSKS